MGVVNNPSRVAAQTFKTYTKGRAPFTYPYVGFLAYAVSIGVPFHIAVDLAYPLDEPELTVKELTERINREALKW